MGCSNNHSEYVESSPNPFEKSLRIFFEELELDKITFYEILSDFNYTFLNFNDVIPEKIFDDYIKNKFKNEHIKTLFRFKEIRSQSGINIQKVRYIFLLLCRDSVRRSNNKKLHDKAEFIMSNIISSSEGEMQIQDEILNLIDIDCKILPKLFSVCNPSINEEDMQYINSLQNYDVDAIYYVMERSGLNAELTIDSLNRCFQENHNVSTLINFSFF